MVVAVTLVYIKQLWALLSARSQTCFLCKQMRHVMVQLLTVQSPMYRRHRLKDCVQRAFHLGKHSVASQTSDKLAVVHQLQSLLITDVAFTSCLNRHMQYY